MSSGDGWEDAGDERTTGLLGDLFALGEEPDEPARVLIVDDEPYVLRAIQRLLKNTGAEVLTAPNGLQAIKLLEEREIAVLISDQFMPGMSGAELLEHARQASPDTVRVMLTGNNDLATAIEAINRGDVFRFVLKPWKNEELQRIVEMAIEQYHIVLDHNRYQDFLKDQNERLRVLNDELERRVEERTQALMASREQISALYDELQMSFDATIQVLLSSMELGDIKIVDHCRRTAARVQQLCDVLGLGDGVAKPLRRAGLLHWIGLIGAPPEMLGTEVEEFDVEQQATWEFHSLLGQQVIQSVPALERTGDIILYYMRRYDDPEFRVGADLGGGKVLDEELLLGCRVLNICSTFERARTIHEYGNHEVVDDDPEHVVIEAGLMKLKQGSGALFDPVLTRRFTEMITAALKHQRVEVRLEGVEGLEPGMVLSRPLETFQGIPVAPRDIVVTDELLSRLELFRASGGLSSIYVWSEGKP